MDINSPYTNASNLHTSTCILLLLLSFIMPFINLFSPLRGMADIERQRGWSSIFVQPKFWQQHRQQRHRLLEWSLNHGDQRYEHRNQ